MCDSTPVIANKPNTDFRQSVVDDVDSDLSYGWGNIVNMNIEKSYKNADNYCKSTLDVISATSA